MVAVRPWLPGMTVRVVSFHEFDQRMDMQLKDLERICQNFRKRPLGPCYKGQAATRPDARAGRM